MSQFNYFQKISSIFLVFFFSLVAMRGIFWFGCYEGQSSLISSFYTDASPPFHLPNELEYLFHISIFCSA